jgi:hypothetical protein
MKKLKYLITAILPNILIILYVISLDSAEKYSNIHYSKVYEIVVLILGNIIIGTYLFYFCKDSMQSQIVASPSKYVLGVIIIPFLLLLSIITAFHTPMFMSYALTSIPQYFVFSSIYIGTFVYSVRIKRKKQKQELS